MKNTQSKYEQEASRLARAIEIAEIVVNESVEIDSIVKRRLLEFGAEMKQSVLFPQPRFKNLASLKYSESDFFTYWNEADGLHIENFWDKVFESNLGYVRKDLFHDVLKRKKIKNIHEFECITDNIVVYEQIGRVTTDQVADLKKYLEEFEKRKVAK